MRKLILPIMASLVLAGCTAQPPNDSERSQPTTRPTLGFGFDHVDEDLERATAKGDFRFVGLMGVGLYIPGVPKGFETSGYGVRVIEGTSDALEGPEDKRFNDAAREYAERYNKLLLKKIAL